MTQRFGMTVLARPAGEIRVPLLDAAPGAACALRIRARDVMLATERPQGLSALNILAGQDRRHVVRIDGPLVDVRIDCNGAGDRCADHPAVAHALDLRLGQEVFAVIKTVSFDRGNTTRGMRFEAYG